MQRIMMKSKIHNAVITGANISYIGSLTIDTALMDKADIVTNERVQVVNLSNGERFETYVIEGERGSGAIELNGPAARLGIPGDRIHILAYAMVDEEELKAFSPHVIFIGDTNTEVK